MPAVIFFIGEAVLSFISELAARLTKRFFLAVAAFAMIVGLGPASLPSYADDTPGQDAPSQHMPLQLLSPKLLFAANRLPGLVAVAIVDLTRGTAIQINGDENLPAASTIKIPVMVEVFRQAAVGNFSLQRTVSVHSVDRDCGSGRLCYAPNGAQFSLHQLLWLMITDSDNTATNMLIRLVGRYNVNQTMNSLGLKQTWLGDVIHSDGDVRELRTSANDMMRLLTMIAEHRVVNDEACDQMMRILRAQHHNKLLPAGLPKGLAIAHKTGTLHDTLNDVGVVELDGAPYIICVLTTHLRNLDLGQQFIRRVSKLTFQTFLRELTEESPSN